MGRVFAVLAALAMALAIAPIAGADEEVPEADLVLRSGEPDPGGKVLLQVEARWAGRPERHLPGRPTVKLPRGATMRVGRTSSNFDGEATRWWTDVVVELPERGGPWTIGPATVPLKAGRLAGTELETDTLSLGRASKFRQLLGEGIGNGVVVVAILLWLGWRWRSLAPTPIRPEVTRIEALLDRADGEDPQACLATLLEARVALGTLEVADSVPPEPDRLRARLDGVRFGGESIGAKECRKLLTALRAVLEETR